MSQIRRRRLLVDARLQGSLLAHVTMYWFYCLLSVGVIAIVWIVFAKRPTTSANLFHELWMNCGPALLGSIALLPLVLLDCLRMSNRLAGPMVRLQNALRDLADGRTPRPVKLREGDFWESFASDVNRLIDQQTAQQASPAHEVPVEPAAEVLPGSVPTAPIGCPVDPVSPTSIYSDLTV